MSGYDPNKHYRRSIRLQSWDYRSSGAYFVTIATHERAHLFGEVVDGAMVVSNFGQVVTEEWERTAQLRPRARLDAFVVIPNHVHGVVCIVDDETAGRGEAPPRPYPPRRKIGVAKRYRGRFQIHRHKAHQPNPRHSRHVRLAAQLLRTHCPQ